MTFLQVLSLVIVGILGAVLTLRYAFSAAKELYADRKNTVSDSAEQPPTDWWEQLESLQAKFGVLRADTEHNLSRAENERQLARSAEERTRRMLARQGDEGTWGPPSPLQLELERHAGKVPTLESLKAEGDWEEEPTVPVAQPLPRFDVAKLERRRGR